MSTHKNIDIICVAVIILGLVLTVLFMNGEALGIQAASSVGLDYAGRLFDDSRVHSLDVLMDDWSAFLADCEDEEYVVCDVVIDGEIYKNVGFRAKGNTSLTTVQQSGSTRYSFKVEFDHYDSSLSYHGLDKLCLNNVIQDNTYMKDYLCYRLMGEYGVAAPLCSYVWITVNGEDWGLYLAVEGVEDAFLLRNYGTDYGDLYKPDSSGMGGGGRGNGRGFDMDAFLAEFGEDMGFPGDRDPGTDAAEDTGGTAAGGGMPQPAEFPFGGGGMGGFAPSEAFGGGEFPLPGMSGGAPGGGIGSDDVKLRYIDDDPDSYSNIFDNAKTPVTKADKSRLIAALKRLGAYEDLEDTLEIDAVLRYFVVHNYVVNGDSYTGSMVHNYYLYEDGGRLAMIPWDYNLAFGGFQGGDASSAVNDAIDTPLSVSGDGDRPMADWMVQGDEYTALYHQYFADFLDSVDVASVIADARALISAYVEKDPTAFCTFEEFETGADTLSQFCALRAESVRGQLEGTIPSTDDGRNAGGAALVDASSITVSDMGSMNGAGQGGPGGDFGGGTPDIFGMSTPPGVGDPYGGSAGAAEPPGMSEMPSAPDPGEPGGDFSGETPGMPGIFPGRQDDGERGPMEEHDGAEEAVEYGSEVWLWFGISIAVLLAGLAFAIAFKKY